MAWEMERTSVKVTRVAKADLSGKQFYFVKLVTDLDIDGNGMVDVCSGTTDIPIGILQNKPKAGAEAEITIIGITKINGDAALGIGDLIGTSADGQVAAYVSGTDTTKRIVGQVLLAPGAAGRIGTAIINCAAPARGA